MKITECKIILPNDVDFYEDYAHKELLLRVKEATGVDLPVFFDNGLPTTENVISIGRTELFKKSGITATFSELTRDGYKIVKKDNVIYLIGGGSYGTVYAVYGFLERQLGYTFYCDDEVFYSKQDNLEIEDYCITDIPDIENRTGGWYFSWKNDDGAIRRKTFTYFGMMRDGEEFFGSWAHNHFDYLPISKYRDGHVDWYSPEFTQLCLSNEEMWVEFAKRVIERIKERPKAEYFLLGQMDRPTFCGCQKCLELQKTIGKSGIMMRFVNYVAREVKKWQNENCPERNILIGTFAYQKTQDPPVTIDEQGNYHAVDESVIPEDNVFIMLAPISADCSVVIDDETHNSKAKKTLEGWNFLTKRCILWIYCSNFDRKFGFFDNFHVLSENYKIFKKYQFRWLYYENNASRGGTAFQPLLCYLHSKLAWDVNVDVKALTEDFMDHYYKESAPYMKEYLASFDRYYKQRKAEWSERDGRYYGTYLWNGQEETSVMDKDFHTWEFLSEMSELLKKAEDAIKNAGYDKEKEQVMLDRILIESLTVKFFIAEFYSHKFNKNEYLDFLDAFKADCEKFEIKNIKRGRTLEIDFNEWREKMQIAK